MAGGGGHDEQEALPRGASPGSPPPPSSHPRHPRPLDVRAVGPRHLAEVLLDVVSGGHIEVARELLPHAESVVAGTPDVSAELTLELARSGLGYMEGAFEEECSRLERSSPVPPCEQGRHGTRQLFRAELLLATDQFDGAARAAAAGLEAARREHQAHLARAWKHLVGRSALQAGRIPEAAATLLAARVGGAPEGVTNAEDGAALVALGRIAIHTGNHAGGRSIARVAQEALGHGGPELRRHAGWILALLAMANGQPEEARAVLARLGTDAAVSVLPLLRIDVADPPHLVRMAIGGGDLDLARAAVTIAEERRRRNPGTTSLAAAAAHARGLAEDDPASLAEAVELLARSPRRLALASALEDLGDEGFRTGDRRRGTEALRRALQGYASAGATWDVSRLQRRLRSLGVRRQLVKVARPATGWGSLTDAELAVVSDVTKGLTNREVAERLFVSPHTVSMHLRHVFTKLGINSRVELTRLAVGAGLPLAHERPGRAWDGAGIDVQRPWTEVQPAG